MGIDCVIRFQAWQVPMKINKINAMELDPWLVPLDESLGQPAVTLKFYYPTHIQDQNLKMLQDIFLSFPVDEVSSLGVSAQDDYADLSLWS